VRRPQEGGERLQYLEVDLGLERGEGAREAAGLEERGDGGDHHGPRVGAGGSLRRGLALAPLLRLFLGHGGGRPGGGGG
jgi:hypothetical protein